MPIVCNDVRSRHFPFVSFLVPVATESTTTNRQYGPLNYYLALNFLW